jgi:hypothetical protein
MVFSVFPKTKSSFIAPTEVAKLKARIVTEHPTMSAAERRALLKSRIADYLANNPMTAMRKKPTLKIPKPIAKKQKPLTLRSPQGGSPVHMLPTTHPEYNPAYQAAGAGYHMPVPRPRHEFQGRFPYNMVTGSFSSTLPLTAGSTYLFCPTPEKLTPMSIYYQTDATFQAQALVPQINDYTASQLSAVAVAWRGAEPRGLLANLQSVTLTTGACTKIDTALQQFMGGALKVTVSVPYNSQAVVYSYEPEKNSQFITGRSMPIYGSTELSVPLASQVPTTCQCCMNVANQTIVNTMALVMATVSHVYPVVGSTTSAVTYGAAALSGTQTGWIPYATCTSISNGAPGYWEAGCFPLNNFTADMCMGHPFFIVQAPASSSVTVTVEGHCTYAVSLDSSNATAELLSQSSPCARKHCSDYIAANQFCWDKDLHVAAQNCAQVSCAMHEPMMGSQQHIGEALYANLLSGPAPAASLSTNVDQCRPTSILNALEEQAAGAISAVGRVATTVGANALSGFLTRAFAGSVESSVPVFEAIPML